MPCSRFHVFGNFSTCILYKLWKGFANQDGCKVHDAKLTPGETQGGSAWRNAGGICGTSGTGPISANVSLQAGCAPPWWSHPFSMQHDYSFSRAVELQDVIDSSFFQPTSHSNRSQCQNTSSTDKLRKFVAKKPGHLQKKLRRDAWDTLP